MSLALRAQGFTRVFPSLAQADICRHHMFYMPVFSLIVFQPEPYSQIPKRKHGRYTRPTMHLMGSLLRMGMFRSRPASLRSMSWPLSSVRRLKTDSPPRGAPPRSSSLHRLGSATTITLGPPLLPAVATSPFPTSLSDASLLSSEA
ncbi:hypothetical protein EYF80_053153 [Liparis tanakae]|uniref:Uncharacterized protein n=1 Tax=Liparis tanakae TaxID=230148 RepID=A0A4Z2F8Q5_9TELE|nr:hypothetical protein EYF80_053153 [Liparis tanakae]